jgi:hypothetical protein
MEKETYFPHLVWVELQLVIIITIIFSNYINGVRMSLLTWFGYVIVITWY